MSKPYSEILSKELDRIDKEYSDPYVYASAMQEYIESKMAVISNTLQDISYISTVCDSNGKPYNIMGIMSSRRIGLLNGDTLPSGDSAQVTDYSSEELDELGDNYFSNQTLPTDLSNLLNSLCDRTIVGDNCIICGSDLIRALIRQRDGLSNGDDALINTLDGKLLSSDNMLASLATQIGEFKVFASGFKAVVESKTSSLSTAFSNNISLIADKFKDKSLSSIFYGLFNQAKDSASQAVSGMMTLLTSSLKSSLDSVTSTGSITNVYHINEYSGLTFSSALGLADMSGFRTVMQNVVLAVAGAGYVVYNLIGKGFSMINSAITKFVWKYLGINQIEFKDGGANAYVDFPIFSARYNINNDELMEAIGDTQILGSTFTIDSFYHYLTSNPEFPSEYGTSLKDIYNSLGDDSNHWIVDLKFALMFLSRIDGCIQMDIYIKPLVMDREYFKLVGTDNINTWDTPAFNYARRNFTAPLADGTEIEINQVTSWASSTLCPARSLGRVITDLNNIQTGAYAMSIVCGYACDAETSTSSGAVHNITSFQTPHYYYPRSIVNRIRSVFPIDGDKHWVYDPNAFMNSRDWSNANWSDSKWILRENTQHEYYSIHWTVIALLTYLWLRINAYIADWDTIVTTQQGDSMHLAHVDIDHGLWCYQVTGSSANTQVHVYTAGALNVPGGGTVITYSSQISADIPYASVDNTNTNVPITMFSRLCNYYAWYTESPNWYYNNNHDWDVPNNFLVMRMILSPGTNLYNSTSDIGNALTYQRACFTFGLSFFVGIWCQILLNKRENMERVYESWNDFPLFIPYNSVDQLPTAQFHLLTSTEVDSYAKVIPTIATIASIAIVAIAAVVTTAIIVKRKLNQSLEMISVASESAKYAFEDDIKAFKNGDMDLATFKKKSKDYIRITKRNKLKSKIYTALGAESISSNYYDLCSQDDEGSDLNNSSSLTEQISTSYDSITNNLDNNSSIITHLIKG